MLVTAVTVVATGLEDSSVGSLDRRIQATNVVVGNDDWSPIDPQVEQVAAHTPGVRAVASIRQDATLAFGQRELVNAMEPQPFSRLFAYDLTAGTAADVDGL